MSEGVRLRSGDGDEFPLHVFETFGVPPMVWQERLGGSVMIVSKKPAHGPLTVMTSGVSRFVTDSGERVELAVEVVDGQEGAAWIALQIVCNDIAVNRRVPPIGTPWRNGTPFLNGTRIAAIVADVSRWGEPFDVVRAETGEPVGRVLTLRLLTDDEAQIVAEAGWEALLARVGSVDSLLDVERPSLAHRM